MQQDILYADLKSSEVHRSESWSETPVGSKDSSVHAGRRRHHTYALGTLGVLAPVGRSFPGRGPPVRFFFGSATLSFVLFFSAIFSTGSVGISGAPASGAISFADEDSSSNNIMGFRTTRSLRFKPPMTWTNLSLLRPNSTFFFSGPVGPSR